MGSAVDEANLTRELTRYAEAGMGGVHIIPIYGAKGFESRYVPYLSPRWLELLAFTVKEADRLGLGIDMSLGTGWCFGGPTVSERDANSIPTFSKVGVTLKPSGQQVKRAAPGGEGHMLDRSRPARTSGSWPGSTPRSAAIKGRSPGAPTRTRTSTTPTGPRTSRASSCAVAATTLRRTTRRFRVPPLLGAEGVTTS